MNKDIIREQFSAEAEAYVHSKIHAQGASLARLVELVEPQSNWRVLDIATGAGHTALAFAPHVDLVIATDITPEMLVQAQQLAQERGLQNINTETADAEALPYGDGTIDLITCRIAPHHFGDIPRFISESVRVLRSDGLLAIVDNIVPSGSTGDYVNAFEKLRDPSHGRCLTIASWTTALEKAGLTIIKQEILDKKLNFNFWAKRHDENMRSYLASMLSEASGRTAEFLQPKNESDGITFRLSEGLFIARKTTAG